MCQICARRAVDGRARHREQEEVSRLKVSEPMPPAGDKMVLVLGMKIHLRAGVVVVAVVDLQDEADEPGKVVSKKQVRERWIELQLSRPFAA